MHQTQKSTKLSTVKPPSESFQAEYLKKEWSFEKLIQQYQSD